MTWDFMRTIDYAKSHFGSKHGWYIQCNKETVAILDFDSTDPGDHSQVYRIEWLTKTEDAQPPIFRNVLYQKYKVSKYILKEKLFADTTLAELTYVNRKWREVNDPNYIISITIGRYQKEEEELPQILRVRYLVLPVTKIQAFAIEIVRMFTD
jgi:hypothetical protein